MKQSTNTFKKQKHIHICNASVKTYKHLKIFLYMYNLVKKLEKVELKK